MTPRRPLRLIAVLLGASVLAGDGLAWAEGRFECPLNTPWTPIGLTLGPADFGAPPPTCARATIGIDARAGLFIRQGAFYGTLVGEAVLSSNVPLGAGFWLSGAVTVARYEFVQNASVIATATDFGPSSVGLHWGARTPSGRLAIAPYLRVLLPTDTGGEYATTFGVELGVAARFTPSPRVSVMAAVSVPTTATRLGGRSLVRLTPRASTDVAFAVTSWLEPVVGLELRLGGDPDGAVELVALKAALRWRPWRTLQVQAAAVAPLAGLERSDLRAALGASYAW